MWTCGIERLGCTLFLPSVPSVDGHETIVASWRYGEVTIVGSHVRSIQARWWPRWGTVFGMWTDRISRSLPVDECRFYYAFPKSSPGFMSLLYTHAGPRTSYATFYRGIETLDRIATLNKAHAIVCQTTNDRLTERMMNRWGYHRHAENLGDGHYIRRF